MMAFNSSITDLKAPQPPPLAPPSAPRPRAKQLTNNGAVCLILCQILVEREKGEDGGDLETLFQFYWEIMWTELRKKAACESRSM